MLADYSSWQLGTYVDVDPKNPEAELEAEHLTPDVVDRCPMLKNATLPAYIRGEVPRKMVLVLCPHSESLTGAMSMARGCAETGDRRCSIHGQCVSCGEDGKLPLNVMNRDVVQVRADHTEQVWHRRNPQPSSLAKSDGVDWTDDDAVLAYARRTWAQEGDDPPADSVWRRMARGVTRWFGRWRRGA